MAKWLGREEGVAGGGQGALLEEIRSTGPRKHRAKRRADTEEETFFVFLYYSLATQLSEGLVDAKGAVDGGSDAGATRVAMRLVRLGGDTVPTVATPRRSFPGMPLHPVRTCPYTPYTL